MKTRCGRAWIRRLTVVAALSAALLAAGCGGRVEDEDCDAEDLHNREPECGYYVDGDWILYPWVMPGVGGKPPHGSHPVPPKTSAPRAKATQRPAEYRPVKPAAPQKNTTGRRK